MFLLLAFIFIGLFINLMYLLYKNPMLQELKNYNACNLKLEENSCLDKIEHLKQTIEQVTQKHNMICPILLVCEEESINVSALELSLKKTFIIIDLGFIRSLSLEELDIIVTHEIYHLKKYHGYKMLLFMAFSSSLRHLSLAYLMFFLHYNYHNSSFLLILSILLILKFLILDPIKMLEAKISRSWEFEADHFAVQEKGYKSYFLVAQKLSFLKRNEINDRFSTHPLWTDRINYINNIFNKA